MNELIEIVKNDQELRPLFFEVAGKMLAVGLSDKFEVLESDRLKILEGYYDSLNGLAKKAGEKFKHEHLLTIIQTVVLFYMSQVGRIGVEEYTPGQN